MTRACTITYSSASQLLAGTANFASRGALLVMPFTIASQAHTALQLMAQRAGSDGLIVGVEDDAKLGFVKIINHAFAASRSPYFGYVAQDAFAGRQWLALALAALQPERAGLLGFNDGKWAGALAGFGLAKRRWVSAQYDGSVFHAGYAQHFADVELTLLALQAGAYVYEPNSLLVEIDWRKDSKAVNARDRALFAQRKRSGFDGKVQQKALLDAFS